MTIDAVTHFTVSAPASAAAGAAVSVTVSASDAANNVVTNYTGTVDFATSDPVPRRFLPTTRSRRPTTASMRSTGAVRLDDRRNPVRHRQRHRRCHQDRQRLGDRHCGRSRAARLRADAANRQRWNRVDDPAEGRGQDAFGNTVTTAAASVTLTITSGTGTTGAVLTCTTNPKAPARESPRSRLQDRPGRHRLHAHRHRDGFGLHRRTSGDSTSSAAPRPRSSTPSSRPRWSPVRRSAPRSGRGAGRRRERRHVEQRDGHHRDQHEPGRRNPVRHRVGPRERGRRDVRRPLDRQGRERLQAPRREHRPDQRDEQHVQRDRGGGGAAGAHPAAERRYGGVAWATQPKVAIQDTLGNTVTTSGASVTLTITSGTGTRAER